MGKDKLEKWNRDTKSRKIDNVSDSVPSIWQYLEKYINKIISFGLSFFLGRYWKWHYLISSAWDPDADQSADGPRSWANGVPSVFENIVTATFPPSEQKRGARHRMPRQPQIGTGFVWSISGSPVPLWVDILQLSSLPGKEAIWQRAKRFLLTQRMQPVTLHAGKMETVNLPFCVCST